MEVLAMTENVGRIDRIIRTALGTGLVAIGVTQLREAPVIGALAAVAGALVLESALTRVCPLNAALGIDTRSRREKLEDAHLEPHHKAMIFDRPKAMA
jgi:hypothetical protein